MVKFEAVIYCGFCLFLLVKAVSAMDSQHKVQQFQLGERQQNATGSELWKEFILKQITEVQKAMECFQIERKKALGWPDVPKEILHKYLPHDLDDFCVESTLREIRSFLEDAKNVPGDRHPLEVFAELEKHLGKLEVRLDTFPILKEGELEDLQKELTKGPYSGKPAIMAILKYRSTITEYTKKMKSSLNKFVKCTKLESLDINKQIKEVSKAMLTFQTERKKASLGWSLIPEEIVRKYVVDNFVEQEATLEEIQNFLMNFNFPTEHPLELFVRMGERNVHFHEKLYNFLALEDLQKELAYDKYPGSKRAIEAVFIYRTSIAEYVEKMKISLASFFEYAKLASLDRMLADCSYGNESNMIQLEEKTYNFLQKSQMLQPLKQIIDNGREEIEKALPTEFQSLEPQELDKLRAELRGDLLEAMLRFASENNRKREHHVLVLAKLEEDLRDESVEPSKEKMKLQVRERINKIVENMRHKLDEQIGHTGEGLKENLRNFGVQQLYHRLAYTASLLKNKLKEIVTSSLDSNKQNSEAKKLSQMVEAVTLHNKLAAIIENFDKLRKMIFENTEKALTGKALLSKSQIEEFKKAESDTAGKLRISVGLLQNVFANLDRIFLLKIVYESLELVEQRDRIREEVDVQTGGPIVEVEKLPELLYMLLENVGGGRKMTITNEKEMSSRLQQPQKFLNEH